MSLHALPSASTVFHSSPNQFHHLIVKAQGNHGKLRTNC